MPTTAITTDSAVMTLTNVFTVDRDHQQELIDLRFEATRRRRPDRRGQSAPARHGVAPRSSPGRRMSLFICDRWVEQPARFVSWRDGHRC